MGTAVWAGRADPQGVWTPASPVIFARGLHQKTCQLLLAPAVSSGTPRTSPLLPRTDPRPSPPQGTPSTPFPGPLPQGSPLLRAAGTRPGRARGGREGRAARGGSRDNTTALTLPRGPPAARGGGRALPADFSPHALARRRREPARPMTRRAAAGRCLPGRAASGTKSPRLLRRRRRRHPSLGGSGEEETDSGGR